MANGEDVAARVGFWDTVRRAGFWRRVLALVIDGLVVTLPLQALVIVLFAQTGGAVQGKFGFTTTYCAAAQLPDGLVPVPPADFTSVTECRVYSLGFETARYLLVAKESTSGTVKTATFQSYGLRADGRPANAFFVDWIAYLLLLGYLIAMEYRSGATIGKRILQIQTIDIDFPSRIGIPFRKALFRHLAMLIGLIPAVILGAVMLIRVLSGADLATIFTSPFVAILIATGLLEFAWIVWITISVASKRDPIYDRLVGTAVILKNG